MCIRGQPLLVACALLWNPRAAPAATGDQLVLVGGDAELHAHPDEASESLNLGLRADGSDRFRDAVPVVYVAEADRWTHVRWGGLEASAARPICPTVPAEPHWLTLDLYVRTDQLLTVTTRAVSLEAGALTVEAGLPVRHETGQDVLVLMAWEARTTLPGDVLGTRWQRPTRVPSMPDTVARRIQVDAPIAVGASSVKATRGDVGVDGERTDGVWVDGVNGPEGVLTVELGCLTAIAEWPPATEQGFDLRSQGSGVFGGALGGLHERQVEVGPGTPLTWSDGSAAGTAIRRWTFWAAEATRPDGCACVAVSTGSAWSAQRWPALTVCAPAPTGSEPP